MISKFRKLIWKYLQDIDIILRTVRQRVGIRESGHLKLIFLICKFSDGLQIPKLNLKLFTIDLQLFTIFPETIDKVVGGATS